MLLSTGITCAENGVKFELWKAFTVVPSLQVSLHRYWQYSHTLSYTSMGKYRSVAWRNCLWAPSHLPNQEKSLPWETQFLISLYWANSMGTDGKKCEVLCDEMSWETVKAWYLPVQMDICKRDLFGWFWAWNSGWANQQFTRLWTLWRIQVIFCGGGRENLTRTGGAVAFS